MPRPSWLTPLWERVEISLGGFVTLTNIGTAYDTINAARGLGLVNVDLTNVVAIDFGVNVNKIGNGTQSWQLWNETDGIQLGVIDDAGGTGNKTLTVTISSDIPAGTKTLRVRAKSTTAADDPLYFGSFLVLR